MSDGSIRTNDTSSCNSLLKTVQLKCHWQKSGPSVHLLVKFGTIHRAKFVTLEMSACLLREALATIVYKTIKMLEPAPFLFLHVKFIASSGTAFVTLLSNYFNFAITKFQVYSLLRFYILLKR